MTIYDALTSRSPLVVSDHPMFIKRLEEGRTCLIFPERNSNALAGCLRRLMEGPDLYARLSQASEQAWRRLQIPVIWGDLLQRWLAGGRGDLEWLSSHSLARYRYD